VGFSDQGEKEYLERRAGDAFPSYSETARQSLPDFSAAMLRGKDSRHAAQYSYLCTGSHDYEHPHMPLTWAPIDIGSECWVASGVFVGPGIEIGNGTVVGACSVVTKSMPEWMVCVGNPCRPLKPRVINPEN
jgi:hypothetical protein